MFKAPGLVDQLVPLYSSVTPVVPLGLIPPNANPAVCVPAPAKESVAADKLFCSDQLLPSYSSVLSERLGSKPPNARAAV